MGAQNIFNERSRASSVTASASTSNIMSRTARAASVAESSSDHFKGYTGYYGKRLAEVMQTQGPTAAEAFAVRGVRASSPAPVIYPSKASASAVSASASASAASASASKTSISASSTSIAQSKTTTMAKLESKIRDLEAELANTQARTGESAKA